MSVTPKRLVFLLALVLDARAARAQLPEKSAVRLEGESPGSLPSSPGILVGNTLYVSGQSGIDSGAERPAAFEDEARRAFANLRRVLAAATMDYANVVSLYVYLSSGSDGGAADRLVREIFAPRPPVASIVGAGRLQNGARILVQAIAVQDGAPRVYVRAPERWKSPPPTAAIQVNGIVYLAGLGATDQTAAGSPRLGIKASLVSLGELLAACGIDYRHVVFVNPYMAPGARGNLDSVYRQFFEFGNTPARATLDMAWVPGGHPIELSAVAVSDLERRRTIRPISRELSATASPAVFAGDVLYLSGFSGFMPGYGVIAEDFDVQVRFAMRNIQDCLETAGMTFENVTSVNAYLGNLDDSERMLRLYRGYFPRNPPALTVIQQSPSGPSNRPIVQFTGIAVRSVTSRDR